jgi:membrane dipeptidase
MGLPRRRHLLVLALALTALTLFGCTRARVGMRERARNLAHEIILLDGHVDLPYRLRVKWEDVSLRTDSGDFDWVRAREGGLDAPFMAIFTPARLEREGGSKAVADSLIDLVETLARDHPDKFAVAVSPDEVERNFAQGVMSLCMGMENGSPIEGALSNLEHFYGRGVRYITPAHGRDNHLCDSSYDTTRTWRGLSPFGREAIREMNRLGIMIDVSHVSDDAFWQIMDLSEAPVIASHSSCRHFVPGWERDMSDDMIRRLAQNGGVIQVNFGSTFVTQRAKEQMERYHADRDAYLAEHGYPLHGNQENAFRKRWLEANPFLFADVQDVADHVDHVAKLVGVDHVGLGSDFDGLGDTLPVGLKDVSQYPNLIHELLARGYSERDIEKIASGNVLRVWREVERVSTR